MSKTDREHFEIYRAQTQAKHTILEKYIYAYFNVMKTTGRDNLIYIDGFAGRGTYDSEDGGTVSGSPIRALEKIASLPDLAAKVTTIFIEQDKELFEQLKTNLDSFYASHPKIRKPIVENQAFSTAMTEIFTFLDKNGKSLAPAFAFVDPCGVAGVDFAVIQRLLRNERHCEVFLFFNIEGVRRILGLKDKIRATLAQLLGSDERARELAATVDSLRKSDEREEAIIRYYEQLLRSHTLAKYVVSFRVEKEDRRITSHYLIHATQHHRGFSIMKDVMWSVGRTSEGKGGLAFEQASMSTMKMMFTPEWDAVKHSILAELEAGMKCVDHFYEALVQQPGNRLCTKAYRTALLELEAEGRIFVISKDRRTPMPNRRRQSGALTLGKGYYVKLL